MKQGRSGQLAFVCVAHEITGENGLALSEEYELVFQRLYEQELRKRGLI